MRTRLVDAAKLEMVRSHLERVVHFTLDAGHALDADDAAQIRAARDLLREMTAPHIDHHDGVARLRAMQTPEAAE